MALLRITPEIIFSIADCLSVRDIDAFTKTHSYFNALLRPFLYRCARRIHEESRLHKYSGKRQADDDSLNSSLGSEDANAMKGLAYEEKRLLLPPLLEMADRGNLAAVKALLLNQVCRVDYTQSDHGNTALCIAIDAGHFDIVKYLVQDAGADLERYSKMRGDTSDEQHFKRHSFFGTPLHRAVSHGIRKRAMIFLLLELGAKIEARFRNIGRSVLCTAACFAQCAETVELLLESGANINAEAEASGKTVLYMIANIARCEQAFLEDSNNLSPMYMRMEEILRILLRHGADIHFDSWGTTPAYMLINAHHGLEESPILNMLLEEGILAWTR